MQRNMALSTGCSAFDTLLGGGYDTHTTTIYGPAATGKSTLVLLAALEGAKIGKVLFIDQENSFSAQRAQQLGASIKQLENILVLRISDFEQQCRQLQKIVAIKTKFSLIVIDTIGIHYRLALAKDPNTANREMAVQLLSISRLSRDTPVILTNQVYSHLGKQHQVGGKFLMGIANSIIELEHTTYRRAILHKPHRRSIRFSIGTNAVT